MGRTTIAGALWYYMENIGGSHDAFVDKLYIRPRFRRSGVGRQLLHEVEARHTPDVDRLKLVAPMSAWGFYQRQGFRKVTKYDKGPKGPQSAIFVKDIRPQQI